jgi:hypothetical protein
MIFHRKLGKVRKILGAQKQPDSGAIDPLISLFWQLPTPIDSVLPDLPDLPVVNL